jgi:hypothetical protein
LPASCLGQAIPFWAKTWCLTRVLSRLIRYQLTIGGVDFNGNVHDWHRGAAWWPELCHLYANPIPFYGWYLGWPNPRNIQMPRTGLAHALIMNMEYRGFQGFQYKRAYLAVPLKAKIPAQTKVYAEFYVLLMNLEEKTSTQTTWGCGF